MFHVSSGYRLESGMQNMSIHTKTTSGYAGECLRLGGQGRRAASTGPSGAAEEAGAQLNVLSKVARMRACAHSVVSDSL